MTSRLATRTHVLIFLSASLALFVIFASAADTALAGLANSPWPMFQGGPQHTGRSTYTGPSSPVLKWSFKLEGLPSSPVIGADGTIYVPTGMLNKDEKGYLYAINPNGTLKWRYRFAGLPSATTPAIASNGTIYVHMNGDEGNVAAVEKLYALNPDGSLKWIFKPNGDYASFASPDQSSPAVGSDGTIYFGAMNTYLFAVTPAGTKKWAVSPSASSITASPAIGSDGTIYCIDHASTFAAYRPDGTARWVLEADTSTGGDGSPMIAPDGTIYVTVAGSSQLLAITPGGAIRWSTPVGEHCMAAPALAADGTIYVGDDGLYAIRPDGTLRWHYRRDVLFSSVPPVVDRSGVIYWREGWDFYAVNRNGTKKWRIEIPPSDLSGYEPAPALGADGTLYVPQPDVFDPSNQYLKAYRSLSPCTITMMLSGLRKGVLKLRRAFTAKGTVISTNLSASKVKLTLQRKSGTKWVKVKIVSRALSATNTCSWKCTPTRKGTYRIRATVAQTATNQAGATTWKSFKVR